MAIVRKLALRECALGCFPYSADLHKGAETGWVWRGLLDVVSVWIGLSSISGMIMLIAMPKRRRVGLVIGVAGTLLALAAFTFFVPR